MHVNKRITFLKDSAGNRNAQQHASNQRATIN